MEFSSSPRLGASVAAAWAVDQYGTKFPGPEHRGTNSAPPFVQVYACRLQQQVFLAVRSMPLKVAHICEQKLLVSARGIRRVLVRKPKDPSMPPVFDASRQRWTLLASDAFLGTRRYQVGSDGWVPPIRCF